MKSTTNFSQPQRQSLLGVVVMFANTLQKSIRAFWPILLIWLVKYDTSNKIMVYAVIVGSIVVVAIISFLQYYFFTFYIDDETNEFVIQKGVFNRTKITIRLQKIQQVNSNQSLIQRLIGVYKLEIDTAGSDKKEASISAVSHELATALKERLINHSAIENVNHIENESDKAPKSLLKISLVSLIKIGFTSNYVKSFALLFIFFTSITENIRQLSDSNVINEDKVSGYFTEFSQYASIGLGIGIIISLVLLVNLVRTVIKYFDFSIQKNKQAILLSYGLLATKNTLLNPNKVQQVKLTQNYFQNKFDIITIGVHQASSDAEKVKDKDKIEIPGCTKNESKLIVELLFSKYPEKGTLFLPNWRKLGVNLFFLLVLPITVGFVVNFETKFLTWNEWLIYASIFSIFVFTLIWFSFKNYKLFVAQDFVIKENGAWDIDTTIVEPYKIQAITTQQFIWQKITNIGSVTLSTAGGSISFSTGNYTEIKKLTNYWLYQIETSSKNWM